jgi:hypothetical protein
MLLNARRSDAQGKKIFELASGDTDYAIIGGGIAYNPAAQHAGLFQSAGCYAPRKDAGSLFHPEEAFNRRFITPSAYLRFNRSSTINISCAIRFARRC